MDGRTDRIFRVHPMQRGKNQPKLHEVHTCSVNTSSDSWTSRVKLNLSVCDKFLCNKSPLEVSDEFVK